MARLQVLNATLAGFGGVAGRQQDCTIPTSALMSTAGPNRRSAMATRRTTKFSEIVPRRPGSFTFNVEAINAIAR